MSLARVQFFSVSLDGFGTGEGQSLETPFGHAGERLHEWMFDTRWWHQMVGEPGGSGGIDDAFLRLHDQGIGAEIMGARKFGPPGWHEDPEWKGWWGPNPPFHTPVFVLTHHPRPSIEMEGGTTFHFIDASPAEALETAREAAGGQDVRIGGGVTVDPRVRRRTAHRPHARRGGPDPAGPGRTPLGRTGGPREGLRDRGHLVAQRRDACDVHACRSTERVLARGLQDLYLGPGSTSPMPSRRAAPEHCWHQGRPTVRPT